MITHIVDVNKGTVEECQKCTKKNKCGKKCKESNLCLDTNISRLRDVIYASKDFLAGYGKKVVDINNYGYTSENYCEKSVLKVRTLHDSLQKKYVSLLQNNPFCLCDEEVEGLIQRTLELLPIRCQRNKAENYIVADKSGLDEWIVNNPNLVAFEKWERALHKFKFDFTFDIKPIECRIAYEFEVKELKCDIIAIFEQVKQVSCDLKAEFETKEKDCAITPQFEVVEKDCKLTYEALVKETPNCSITYNTYVELLQCGITHEAVATLSKCGLTIIPSQKGLFYQLKNGQIIETEDFDVQVLDKILKK